MKKYIKSTLVTLGALALLLPVTGHSFSSSKSKGVADHVGTLPSGPEITEKDIESAQKMWGDAVVEIGKAKDPSKAAKSAAETAYAFELGPIQFKPTLTHGESTFRPDLEGTLSYFVGGNKKYQGDGLRAF